MPVVLTFLPFAGTSASETISFTMPENIVLGSDRAHISFLGEFLEESWKVILFPAGHISSGATASFLANRVIRGNTYSKVRSSRAVSHLSYTSGTGWMYNFTKSRERQPSTISLFLESVDIT